jgi:hypothetical protein
VDFSKARGLFVNIFQTRGLTENDGLRVNFGKPEGLKCEMSEITEFRIYFRTEKPVSRVHGLWTTGTLVHSGPVAIAALGSLPELGLRPLQCPRAPTKGRARGRAGQRTQWRGHRDSGGGGRAAHRRRRARLGSTMARER